VSALTSVLRTVPTVADATNPSSDFDELSQNDDSIILPFPRETIVIQNAVPFTEAAMSSHNQFAPLGHGRDSVAVTTNSALSSERKTSRPMPSDYVEPSIHQDQYAEFLDRVEEKQEYLRDTRESLLGSRFRLQVQRRELTATREKAASQAGAAYNRLRRYLVDIGINPPVEIELELSEAEALRNKLGTEEVEYDEAEKAYNFEEWRYTAKESQFIDELYGTAPAPSQPDGSYPPFDEYGASARVSFGPQDIANMVAESEGDLYLPTQPPEMPLEDEHGLSESQSTVPGVAYQATTNSSIKDTAATRTSHVYSRKELLFEELAIGHSRLKWTGTRRYIDEWLLGSLGTSRLEQGRLKHHEEFEIDLSDKDWWNLVEQLWYSDTLEGHDFHTGDTTVSEESLNEPFSSNTMHRLFATSDMAEVETQQFPPTPLLAHDRVLDAPELANFPTDIEPLDLIDLLPKEATCHDRSFSPHSESTHPTNLTRASSRLDYSSHSTTEENWFTLARPEYDIAQPREISYIRLAIRDPQHGGKPEAAFADDIPQPRLDVHDVHLRQRTKNLYTHIDEPLAQGVTGSHSETDNFLFRPHKQHLSIYEPYIRNASPDSWSLPVYD
jgi:hypothetical protein